MSCCGVGSRPPGCRCCPLLVWLLVVVVVVPIILNSNSLSEWIALSLYTFATASTRQQPPGTEKRHVNNPKEALELPPLSLDRPHSERGNVTPQKGIFTQKRHDMPTAKLHTLYGLFHSLTKKWGHRVSRPSRNECLLYVYYELDSTSRTSMRVQLCISN